MRIVSGSLDRTIKVVAYNSPNVYLKTWNDICIPNNLKLYQGLGSHELGVLAYHGLDVWGRPYWCRALPSGDKDLSTSSSNTQ